MCNRPHWGTYPCSPAPFILAASVVERSLHLTQNIPQLHSGFHIPLHWPHLLSLLRHLPFGSIIDYFFELSSRDFELSSSLEGLSDHGGSHWIEAVCRPLIATSSCSDCILQVLGKSSLTRGFYILVFFLIHGCVVLCCDSVRRFRSSFVWVCGDFGFEFLKLGSNCVVLAGLTRSRQRRSMLKWRKGNAGQRILNVSVRATIGNSCPC